MADLLGQALSIFNLATFHPGNAGEVSPLTLFDDPAPRWHPLDPLTKDEMCLAVSILRGEGSLHGGSRLIELSLNEPDKDAVLGWVPGQPVPREAFAIVNHAETGTAEAIVSLDERRIAQWTPRPGVQPAITLGEFVECEQLVRSDNDFRHALALRGIDDPERVLLEAWGIGGLAPERYAGRRIAWTPCWVRPDDADNPYARPIEGLFAIVDLNEMVVLEIEDHGLVPLPPGGGRYFPEHSAPLRTDVRPIEVTQPEGTSFAVDGWHISWQKWKLRLSFTPREGLVLNAVTYEDAGHERSVLYRASCAELIVPYGDPSPGGYRKNAFDVGEYGLGPMTNSLELGCDCLGEIRYFDVDLCDDRGQTYTIKNAICLHEEDAGLLWKHFDSSTGRTEVRRSRRLVISFIVTLSNYEYAFYWHLYQDGTLGVEIALTGIVITNALRPGEMPRHGTLIAQQLAAPYHQHFFSFRLDFDVDGSGNTVHEVHTETTPVNEENKHGVAFETKSRPLRTEREAERCTDPSVARFWRIVNPSIKNAVGQPVGYRLVPGPNVLPFAAVTSDVLRRAPFLRSHLWVTQNDADQRYPAGAYPNQGAGGDGLASWVAADRSVEDQDIVLWYTLGSHHIPRLEDWPVMPVDRIAFMLKPDGFFNQSPALDVPPSHRHIHGKSSHCSPDTEV